MCFTLFPLSENYARQPTDYSGKGIRVQSDLFVFVVVIQLIRKFCGWTPLSGESGRNNAISVLPGPHVVYSHIIFSI